MGKAEKKRRRPELLNESLLIVFYFDGSRSCITFERSRPRAQILPFYAPVALWPSGS